MPYCTAYIKTIILKEIKLGFYSERGVINMLLVKGKAGKSFVLEQIHNNTNSLAFIYYNQPVIDGGIWINSDTVDFNGFMANVSKYLDKIEHDIWYDYLIIYTNKGEIPIRNKRDLIEEWEKDYGVTVVIGCK